MERRGERRPVCMKRFTFTDDSAAAHRMSQMYRKKLEAVQTDSNIKRPPRALREAFILYERRTRGFE
jgi:hypothetical protein